LCRNIRENGEQLDRPSLAVRFGDVKAPRFTRAASAVRHERYSLPNSAQPAHALRLPRWRHLRTPRPDRVSILMDSFPASDPPASSAMAVSAAAPDDL
jgi:hypothetical protein